MAKASYERHGMRGTRTYLRWIAMYNRTRVDRRYTPRSIQVCDRWRSFPNFLADMGECPPGMSLDRIDNNGDYEPGNCRWATQRQQMGNRRNTVWVVYRGTRLCLQHACDQAGINAQTVHTRAHRKAISHQEAFDHYAIHSYRHVASCIFHLAWTWVCRDRAGAVGLKHRARP